MYYYVLRYERPENLEQKMYQKLEKEGHAYSYINTVFNVLKKSGIYIEDATEEEIFLLKQALNKDPKKLEAAIIAIEKKIDLDKILLPEIDNETAKVLAYGYIHGYDLLKFTKYGAFVMHGVYNNIEQLNDSNMLEDQTFVDYIEKFYKLDCNCDASTQLISYFIKNFKNQEQCESLLKCISKCKYCIDGSTIGSASKLVANGVKSIRKTFDNGWDFYQYVQEKI